MTTISVRNLTRRPSPRFAYQTIAEAALPGWDISLAYVQPKQAAALNKQLRKKTYTPNVLSYETGKKSGEIIICLSVAKEQAKDYDLSYTDFVAYLFIHGLMHLKGHPHGTTMDKKERVLMTRFITSSFTTTNATTTHRNRNRYRNASNEDRRR